MKKIIITISIATGTWTTAASQNLGDFKFQNSGDFKFEALHVVGALLTTVFIGVAILTFIKRLMDYRLKNKLIEKGAPEEVISNLLNPITADSKNITVKWFALLTGLGAGLFFVDYFQPLGIHSVAIMALSLAASFLGYSFYLNHKEKP
jgi:hypothetical protein